MTFRDTPVGNALLEVVLFFPLGVILLAGTVDAGWALWRREQLESAIAAAARAAAVSPAAQAFASFDNEGSRAIDARQERRVLTRFYELLRMTAPGELVGVTEPSQPVWQAIGVIVSRSTDDGVTTGQTEGSCVLIRPDAAAVTFVPASDTPCSALHAVGHGSQDTIPMRDGTEWRASLVVHWSGTAAGFGATLFADVFPGIYGMGGTIREPLRMTGR